jgi:hypothetical protein
MKPKDEAKGKSKTKPKTKTKTKIKPRGSMSEVPLILWTPLRHNQPKEVSDEDAAKEVHIGV